MKKLRLITIIAVTAMLLAGCNGGGSSSTSTSSGQKTPLPDDTGLPKEIKYTDENSIMIHYQRYNGSYAPWYLWLWAEGKDGDSYKYNYADDYGVLAYYPLSIFNGSETIGFIVRDDSWNKDYSSDRFMDLSMLKKDNHNVYHIYIQSGAGTVYTNKECNKVMNAVKVCEFEDTKTINFNVNNKISSPVVKKNGAEVQVECVTENNKNFKLKLSEDAKFNDNFTVTCDFGDDSITTKNVSIRKLINDSFDEEYKYEGDLGAIYTTSTTEFKVWSPIANSMELFLYDNGTPTSVDASKGSDEHTSYSMTRGEKGVWSVSIDGNLEGKYYTYNVVSNYYPEGKEVVDPYAKGAGVNGLRGMVVDFSKAQPEGWENVQYSTVDRNKLTIYETHVADVTSSDSWTGTKANKYKYAGMYEAGTTYTEKINGSDVTVKTGFDHIKELGVNAVQIIPFFDQSNDEVNVKFNWGYNPLNYNVVEGCYSSDPFNGYVRIKELRELVKAYSEAGISIIMDVVYNHVNGLSGSNFDTLMPYYYFRYDNDTGSASNGSGCGNETASERPMFRKFMIDSACFWTEYYKIGGFRFDLMGCHDIDTMNQLTAEVKKINPYSVIHGEPWAGGTTHMKAGLTPATQANTKKYVGYGQFNDQMRDAMLKSGMNPTYAKGWITHTNSAQPAGAIIDGMMGITSSTGETDPNKTVNYATCHDNYTIHDRCLKAGIMDEATIEKMNCLANSLVFCSQGTTFMLAGEEMLRTKVIYDANGNTVEAVDDDGKPLGYPDVSGNSYDSCYKTNELNYSWKAHHLDLFENYQKLINLKQTAEGLSYKTAKDIDANYYVTDQVNDGRTIYAEFKVDGKLAKAYFTNGVSGGEKNIDLTGATILLDTINKNPSGAAYKLQPFETIIYIK